MPLYTRTRGARPRSRAYLIAAQGGRGFETLRAGLFGVSPCVGMVSPCVTLETRFQRSRGPRAQTKTETTRHRQAQPQEGGRGGGGERGAGGSREGGAGRQRGREEAGRQRGGRERERGGVGT